MIKLFLLLIFNLNIIFAQEMRSDLARFITKSDCVMITLDNKTDVNISLVEGKISWQKNTTAMQGITVTS